MVDVTNRKEPIHADQQILKIGSIPRIAGCTEHGKSGNNLNNGYDQQTEIGKGGQGVVPDVVNRFGSQQQHIHLYSLKNAVNLFAGNRDKIVPPGKGIAGKGPVYTYRQIDYKYKSGDEMCQPHPPEPIIKLRGRAVHNGRRVSDNKPGYNQNCYGKSIYPMENTYGQLPYIYFSQRRLSTNHILVFLHRI